MHNCICKAKIVFKRADIAHSLLTFVGRFFRELLDIYQKQYFLLSCLTRVSEGSFSMYYSSYFSKCVLLLCVTSVSQLYENFRQNITQTNYKVVNTNFSTPFTLASKVVFSDDCWFSWHDYCRCRNALGHHLVFVWQCLLQICIWYLAAEVTKQIS